MTEQMNKHHPLKLPTRFMGETHLSRSSRSTAKMALSRNDSKLQRK